jgi:hypothetical protein
VNSEREATVAQRGGEREMEAVVVRKGGRERDEASYMWAHADRWAQATRNLPKPNRV